MGCVAYNISSFHVAFTLYECSNSKALLDEAIKVFKEINALAAEMGEQITAAHMSGSYLFVAQFRVFLL